MMTVTAVTVTGRMTGGSVTVMTTGVSVTVMMTGATASGGNAAQAVVLQVGAPATTILDHLPGRIAAPLARRRMMQGTEMKKTLGGMMSMIDGMRTSICR